MLTKLREEKKNTDKIKERFWKKIYFVILWILNVNRIKGRKKNTDKIKKDLEKIIN